MFIRIAFATLLVISHFAVFAQQKDKGNKIQASGVFPDLAMVAGHSPRTEAGMGAMMPWADRLWIITYVAHT